MRYKSGENAPSADPGCWGRVAVLLAGVPLTNLSSVGLKSSSDWLIADSFHFPSEEVDC